MGWTHSSIVVLLSGCISVGGGTALNVSVDGSTTRRVGGAFEIGNFVEIVEDRLVGKLFYGREYAPFGERSGSAGVWGGRIAHNQLRGLPGLYVQGAFGWNDAELATIGAGVLYGRHDARLGGRFWTGLRTGLTYHRQVIADDVGHFLGFEVAVDIGYDVIGPMYTSD